MTTAIANQYGVTDEQIGMAHKIFGPDNKPFYKVENSRGELDAEGSIREYTVKAIFRKGKWHLTCTCLAGQEGRLCWHKRAAMAATEEEKYAMAEQARLADEAKAKAAAEQPKPKARKSFDEGEALYRSRMRGIADILAAKRMCQEVTERRAEMAPEIAERNWQ